MFDKATVTRIFVAVHATVSDVFICAIRNLGIEILRVQEIKNYSRVTPIPIRRPTSKGVMNLRGTVIPIVDLRNTLGMSSAEYDKFTVIIVVNIDSRIVGLVVDAVSMSWMSTKPTSKCHPGLSNDANVSVVNGIAKPANRLIPILNH